jgi:leucine dehydrogenase
MDKTIRDWDGEFISCRYDRPTGTMMFISFHSTALGIACGGTRLKTYIHSREALRDSMRLAEGMTYKFVMIGFPRGGGKAVLSVPKDFKTSDREGLMTRYGQWLSDLNRIFETGPDLGTGPEDMAIINRYYSGVFGLPVQIGGAGDPGPATAQGVFYGIKASCLHRFKTSDLADRTILVQGAGSVGEPLIRLLLDAGCEVQFSDIDPKCITKICQELGISYVKPENVYKQPCDVFAPCAIGGILNRKTIPQLACHIVAGAANNQLDQAQDGDALYERGILYAPDYVINSGGAIFLIGIEGLGWTDSQVQNRIHRIRDTLSEVFGYSEEHGISPARAANQIAKERVKLGALKRSQNK